MAAKIAEEGLCSSSSNQPPSSKAVSDDESFPRPSLHGVAVSTPHRPLSTAWPLNPDPKGVKDARSPGFKYSTQTG
jgi:hypothetical protein